MSRYKAYPSYKETRHSWLESVPAHWKMLPLKFLTAQHVTDGPHETPEFIDEGVPFLSVDGIQNNHLVFEGCRYISKEDHARYSIKCKPNQGDVLLGKAASVGKVAHVDTDIEFNVWSPLAVIRPRSEKTGRFIYYSLQSALLQMQCDMYSNANTQKNLGMSTIDNLAFASPTDDEAEQIAYFLDHETAKIDVLIEKQQRLIELLKEKRQAVISHAVTKGLNPNAPMKESGVEWLGEVPAHWGVTYLKYATSMIVDCPHETPIYSEDGQYLVIRTADLDEGNLDSSRMYRVEEGEYVRRIRRAELRQGDIVYGREGERWGHAGLVPEDGKYCLGQRMMQFRADIDFSPGFLMWLLNSDNVYKQGQLDTVGATSPHVNVATIRNFSLAQPPLVEQQEICSFLIEKTGRFDALTKKALDTVFLLQERRTALISAAVTGKIDVRDWQPAAVQEVAGVDC